MQSPGPLRSTHYRIPFYHARKNFLSTPIDDIQVGIGVQADGGCEYAEFEHDTL